jgi:hypothetical protein
MEQKLLVEVNLTGGNDEKDDSVTQGLELLAHGWPTVRIFTISGCSPFAVSIQLAPMISEPP